MSVTAKSFKSPRGQWVSTPTFFHMLQKQMILTPSRILHCLGLYYISNKYLQLSLWKSSRWVIGTGPTEGKAYCSSTDLFRVCGNFIKNGLYFKLHFNTVYTLCSKTIKHLILIKLKDFSSLICAAQLTIRLIMV